MRLGVPRLPRELWGMVGGLGGLGEEELVCTLECAVDLEGPHPDVFPLVEGWSYRVVGWWSLFDAFRSDICLRARMMAGLGHPAKRLVFRVVLVWEVEDWQSGFPSRPRQVCLVVKDRAQFFLRLRALLVAAGLEVSMSNVFLEVVYPSGYQRRDEAELAALTGAELLSYAYESDSERVEREATMDLIPY